ncbi:copper amine oxidase N-terminal domain-containing protein [Paenibacillaceae bacterium]|nr:copper amine oxidase N-terminal domain-containing protein [Paenibacillaceae bacterium]
MMKLKWLAAATLAVALLLPAGGNSTSAAAYSFGWEQGGVSGGPVIVKKGVTYVAIQSVIGTAGLQMQWDKSDQRASFTGWNKKFAVRIGSSTGVLDGKTVDLGGTPFMDKDDLYIPARFVVNALDGGPLHWDKATGSIKANGLQMFVKEVDSETYDGATYSLERNDTRQLGDLFVTGADGVQKKLITLEAAEFDFVSFQFHKTSKGLTIVTVLNNFGEPHINYHYYTLVLKNGNVIRKADVRYWQRNAQNIVEADGQIVVTNGKTVRFIEDGTGNVLQTLDLEKIGKSQEVYSVEAADNDFLLMRPNQTGLLTFVDRHTSEAVVLYKQLLSPEEQHYAETNDIPYFGDELQFIERKGDTLYFKNKSGLTDDKKIYEFKLPVKTS